MFQRPKRVIFLQRQGFCANSLSIYCVEIHDSIIYIVLHYHKTRLRNWGDPYFGGTVARSASICRSKQIPDSRQIAEFFLVAILSDIRC